MTARHFFKCCRLLVVLTEGGDLCSLNKESLLETCENGVQGVLFAGCRCSSTSADEDGTGSAAANEFTKAIKDAL